MTGSFNGVKCGKYFLCNDPNNYMEPGKHRQDKALIKRILEFHDVVEKQSGLEPKFFDLTQFEKSGADLGCLVMYMNYHGW